MGSNVVSLKNIHKAYSGREVLRGVSLDLRPGTVHSFVGENGAGKSTLVKILAGVTTSDWGEVQIDGVTVRLDSPRSARRMGISLVSQELSLIPKRSVIENVLAGQIPTIGLGWVSSRRMRARFEELVASSGIDVPPATSVELLNPVQQEFVEILRAMAGESRVLILDEPTTAMTRDQSDTVLNLCRRLADKGLTVILVSHTLEDVLRISDRISVLRDGLLVSTHEGHAATRDALIHDMIGRPLEDQYPERPVVASDAPLVLRVREVAAPPVVKDVSLDVRAGEILGVAGLVGSGRSEFARALVAADRLGAGTIELDGQRARIKSVQDAQRHGIVMVPENRKTQGLHLDHSIERNVTLPHLRRLSRYGWMIPRRTRQAATRGIDNVHIRSHSMKQSVRSLSGGNQQRVLFAKWLVDRPRVLIADEPTRGVDIAGKRAIYELLVELAAAGTAVVVISSEMPEIIGLANRVVVFHKGRVAAELTGENISEHNIVRAAFGADGEQDSEANS